jgi:hypothetical protein
LIYGALLELNKKSVPVDVLTITEYLKNNGSLEAAGGEPYVASLIDLAPVTTNVTTWTPTMLVLSGLGGSSGGSYVFDPGDTFTIDLLDPTGTWLSGSATCPPTLITSVQAIGSGETTEYVINGQQFGSWGGGATADYNSPWTWFYDNSKGWVGWHSQTAIYYGSITEWTPTQIIVNPGFGGSYGRSGTNWYVSAGDGVNITIANPQTGTSSGYNFTQP